MAAGFKALIELDRCFGIKIKAFGPAAGKHRSLLRPVFLFCQNQLPLIRKYFKLRDSFNRILL